MKKVEEEADRLIARKRSSMNVVGSNDSGRLLSEKKVEDFTQYIFNGRLPNAHHVKKAQQIEVLLCLYEEYRAGNTT